METEAFSGHIHRLVKNTTKNYFQDVCIKFLDIHLIEECHFAVADHDEGCSGSKREKLLHNI